MVVKYKDERRLLFFGLVDGISNFMGYLMLKQSLLNNSDTIQPIVGELRRFMPFPLGYQYESERNRETEVRTRLLLGCNPPLKSLCHGDQRVLLERSLKSRKKTQIGVIRDQSKNRDYLYCSAVKIS